MLNPNTCELAPVSNRPKVVEARLEHDPIAHTHLSGRDEVLQRNASRQVDGIARCTNCDVKLVKPKKSQRGVTPPKNEAQVNHIERRRNGGSGTVENSDAQCRGCNRARG